MLLRLNKIFKNKIINLFLTNNHKYISNTTNICMFYLYINTIKSTVDLYFEIYEEIKRYLFYKKIKYQKDIKIIHNKKIKILRIENKKGIGPYRSINYNNKIDKQSKIINIYHSERNPVPEIDMPVIWTFITYSGLVDKFKFGFSDLEQLNKWFSIKEQKILKEKGFFIKEYETNIYYKTDKQLVYTLTDNIEDYINLN